MEILQYLIQAAALGLMLVVLWHGFKPRFVKSADEGADEQRVCLECGYDLRASPHRCPECGAVPFNRREYLRSLREDWPADPIEPRKPLPGEQLVVLTDAADEREGPMLADQLKARGIACLVQAGSRPGLGAYNLQRVNFCTVLVYANDVDLAYEYLWRARGIPADMLEALRSEGLTRRAADRRVTL